MSKLNLWKTVFSMCVFCAVEAIASPAQTLKSLVSFDGANGAAPWYPMALLQGTNGNFYGATTAGGANDSCVAFYQFSGCGTVFKVTQQGALTTLYSFCSQSNCTDGEFPAAGLALGIDGDFYGTTQAGGAHGGGTVFEITSAGKLITVYSFCALAGCTDGEAPLSGLVLGSNGSFYGTTFAGGSGNNGVVFEITPAGKMTTLQDFDGSDGAGPIATLFQANNDTFYGTTVYGGAYGYGTVYQITPEGVLSALYSFCEQGPPYCPDGFRPYAGLVQASNGQFYGATYAGGTDDQGTVYKITSTGTLTTLVNFDFSDGSIPYTRMALATDGNFYGTTGYGGANANCSNNCGSIFRMTPQGVLSTLHSFDSSDGAHPYGGLIQSTNGKLYGTTGYGGTSDNCVDGCGTVFSLSVGLGPFAETNPTSGKVGTKVVILGNNLKGSTSVTFNGTAAKPFTVNSTGTAITTTVPSGATTGYVKVKTPTRTLASNVKFRVP